MKNIIFLLATTITFSLSCSDGARGGMLGPALGDAIGNPTEFIMDAKLIYAKWPLGIRDFCDFQKRGTVPYTDDTAMSKATVKGLLASKDLHLLSKNIAREYIKDMHDPEGWAKPDRAPGMGCLKNIFTLAGLRFDPTTWSGTLRKFQRQKLIDATPREIPGYGLNAGLKEYHDAQKLRKQASGGCGALMRVHPFGIKFYDNPDLAGKLAAEHSLITHGAPSSVAACAALACGVAHALQNRTPHEIIKIMIDTAQTYDPETAAALRDAVELAQKNRAFLQTTDDPELLKAQQLQIHNPVFTKYLGWGAKDALAAVIYIFALYPNNIKMAHYLGVHTPGDSDSIASIAGALVGARVGYQAIEKAYGKEMLARLEGHDALLKLAADLQAPRA